ncbi:MAG: YHS domain-containing protein [Candidatus Rokubacteria bacterium]|nr:YHS domain-containing protein [Candidatus Rokubacteria bacterium]
MLAKLLSLLNGRRAKDQVCGMSVARPNAATHAYLGETYYFCSERCRDRFRAFPARYLELPVKVPDSSTGGGCC